MTTQSEPFPPPRPPESFTLSARSATDGHPEDGHWEFFYNIVHFEPLQGAYFAMDRDGRKFILPFQHWNLIEVTNDKEQPT